MFSGSDHGRREREQKSAAEAVRVLMLRGEVKKNTNQLHLPARKSRFFVLVISSYLAHPGGDGVESAVRPSRRESHGGTTEYTSTRVPRCMVLHEHKHAASCHADSASSFFMHGSVECAVAQRGAKRGKSDYVQRLERCSRTQGKKRKKKKTLSFAKISATSGASQTGLRIKMSQLRDFSFHQTRCSCSLFCDIVPKPPRSRRSSASSHICAAPSSHPLFLFDNNNMESFPDPRNDTTCGSDPVRLPCATRCRIAAVVRPKRSGGN